LSLRVIVIGWAGGKGVEGKKQLHITINDIGSRYVFPRKEFEKYRKYLNFNYC